VVSRDQWCGSVVLDLEHMFFASNWVKSLDGGSWSNVQMEVWNSVLVCEVRMLDSVDVVSGEKLLSI
jgi:hypothetical protein